MSAKRDRIGTVLRVRRAQEAQAAGELSRASLAAREAERTLSALYQHYEHHRDVDTQDASVPDRIRDHELRSMHARAIQRGRTQVREIGADVDLRRTALIARSQAVRAMERLDERVREEEAHERRRQETRDQDEAAIIRATRSDDREVTRP